MAQMEKRHIAILYDQHLLGESLTYILAKVPNAEISCFWILDNEVLANLAIQRPDILLVVEEDSHLEKTAYLFGQILETYPSLPVIHIKLAQDILHVFTSQSFPARSVDLVDAVLRLTNLGKS